MAIIAAVAVMGACTLPTLVNKPLQSENSMAEDAVDVYVRIEGKYSTIWRGDTALSGDFNVMAYKSGNTYTIDARCPLGALDAASKQGGFGYDANDEWIFWDLFVDGVESEKAAGWEGWSYRVNYVATSYGPAYSWHSSGTELSDDDEILWYWGTFGTLPLKISADKSQGYMGEQFTITVSTLDKDYWHNAGEPWPQVSWMPVADASVYVEGYEYITGVDGKVLVTLTNTGNYDLYAEKSGYVRSDGIQITVLPKIIASVDIDPDTLNLKSKGKWITAYIEFPFGHDVAEIDLATILLEDSVSAETDPKYGFVKGLSLMDHDNDGIMERMVKFERDNVKEMISEGMYSLKVSGLLNDGTPFEGYSDVIRVI